MARKKETYSPTALARRRCDDARAAPPRNPRPEAIVSASRLSANVAMRPWAMNER